MKRLTSLLFALFAFCSCTDFQEEEVPVAFGVGVNRFGLSSASSTLSITVCSGEKWDIPSMPEWISLQTINHSSASPYEWNAVFSVLENEEYNRDGIILFQAGSDVTQVLVEQDGIKGEYVEVESVSLATEELTMAKGKKASLAYTISPANATNKQVSWQSSSPSIASVGSQSGLIDALAVGTTRITVTTADGKKTASCKVTVVIPVESVSLDKTRLTMTEGDVQEISATVSPSNATDKSITWSSDNKNVAVVAKVGSSYSLYALAAGLATITVKTNDGAKTATCQVTVKSNSIPVSGISLNKSSLSLAEGDSEYLYATITPSDATDKSVSWTSNNTSIATVSSSGYVTAKSVGNAIITATTTDGSKKATCKVTVLPVAVTGVTLNKYSLSMYENDSETLIATITPSNATNKDVAWSSNNNAVATVNSNGQVLAKAAGSAVITVTTADGQITADCSVSVKSDPYGALDLGLSVKWASFNYGASSITSTGGYYMWGDPTGTGTPMFFDPPSVNNISGTQYDIVRKNWGGNWRIPTRAEINELYSNCTWTVTTLNGVSVIKVTGRNGVSIYLPFTGYGMPDDGPIGTITISDGNKAYMMSAESYGDSYGRFVYVFSFTSSGGKSSVSYNASFMKFPIRPVR